MKQQEAIKDLVQQESNTSQWKINCDGYYPYCGHCLKEPPRDSNDVRLYPYCPFCGYKMLNFNKI